ncbi:phosphopyruvate hydratase [Luteimicrobium xylanilyticum]|uniref:Enolase n=1 Tax=Luteimicrobium xylanilyticum TaxID=1133546 RepID=A0A5P9Q7M8_9MICO|nr:phosphopyruvate hydratase [Luteimicrobium xylanilyticum]QFU97090.1 Phosphopyruvate hydratase [Luteimicrobium xylanilyticum]
MPLAGQKALQVARAQALQILDSRGRPTVQVALTLDDGYVARGAAPSGASTGENEAVEVRDGGRAYGGAGVTGVVRTITDRIGPALEARTFGTVGDVDELLHELDGTDSFAGIGSNASVSVSIAAARAFAHLGGSETWRWVADTLGTSPRLPVPHFNVINGGAHAPNPLAFQEFMVAPVGASTFADAVRAGAEVYASLRGRLRAQGKLAGVGDEGGFAPDIDAPDEALDLLVGAIEDAGYTPRTDVAIAMDPAANGFGTPTGIYVFSGREHERDEMLDLYARLVRDYPVWSLEDPFHEEDLESWRAITAHLGDEVQIVGDDLCVTSAERIDRGAADGESNAVLIKPNQTGTVTGTFDALRAASSHGMGAMVSHRSGETLDAFIADLVVGAGTGQLKSGAPARGERVAKYNRLLEIEAADSSLPYGLAPRA